MKLIAILLFASTAIAATTDDIKQDFAKIAAMPNSIERLAAYDSLAAKLGLSPNSQKKETLAGKWKIKITTSPIDDSQIVIGSLDADTPIHTDFGESTPSLILRYKEGTVDAYISFDVFLGSEHIPATVRFGKESAVDQDWSISTDSKAAFFKDNVDAFMSHLARVDAFLIRITPYQESPVTASFSISGIGKVIDAIHLAATAKKR